MTYKLNFFKSALKEWKALAPTIKEQFKKKLAERLEKYHPLDLGYGGGHASFACGPSIYTIACVAGVVKAATATPTVRPRTSLLNLKCLRIIVMLLPLRLRLTIAPGSNQLVTSDPPAVMPG